MEFAKQLPPAERVLPGAGPLVTASPVSGCRWLGAPPRLRPAVTPPGRRRGAWRRPRPRAGDARGAGGPRASPLHEASTVGDARGGGPRASPLREAGTVGDARSPDLPLLFTFASQVSLPLPTEAAPARPGASLTPPGGRRPSRPRGRCCPPRRMGSCQPRSSLMFPRRHRRGECQRSDPTSQFIREQETFASLRPVASGCPGPGRGHRLGTGTPEPPRRLPTSAQLRERPTASAAAAVT